MRDYVLFDKKNGATNKDYTLIDLDLQSMLSLPKAFASDTHTPPTQSKPQTPPRGNPKNGGSILNMSVLSRM